MSFREKLGFEKGDSDSTLLLRLYAAVGIFVAFLVFGPILFPRVNAFLTLLCINTSKDWYAPVIFSIGITFYALLLFINYQQAHQTKFDMEYMLDANEQELTPLGKGTWIPAFRESYRRRTFIHIVSQTIFLSAFVMYFEITVGFSLIIRHHISIMKGTCSDLSFAFLEKIYIDQFLKDIPFSIGNLFNLYGKCTPDADIFAVKLMTTLANSLHWFLILFLVSFIWGKQIKSWFFPRRAAE